MKIYNFLVKKYFLYARITFSGLFLLTNIFSVYAIDPMMPFSPYGFGPEGKNISNQEFYKPKDMLDIVPNRPIVAKDKNGNRLYFTPSGKLTLKISMDGKQEFTFNGESTEKNPDGSIVNQSKVEQMDNKFVRVNKNDKNQVTGYQELAFGGRVVKSYDAEGNVLNSNYYNQYGKSVEWMIDEVTLTKTIFNEKGQAVYDLNFEGYKVAWYNYDENGKLAVKTDIYGNKTYFNEEHGNMSYTTDPEGRQKVWWTYDEDENGRWGLKTAVEGENVTIFKNNKQVRIETYGGAVTKEFKWDGERLVYSFDKIKNETTWYDFYNKPMYTTYNDILIEKWLYNGPQLVGKWNGKDCTVTLYKNQREELVAYTGTVYGENPPTTEDVKKWIDEGIIEVAHYEVETKRMVND